MELTKAILQLLFILLLCFGCGSAIDCVGKKTVPTRYKVYVWLGAFVVLLSARMLL